MKQGDVVLTPVPQAAGVIKNRPAIFLQELPPYRDLLVCGVSTQLPQDVKGFDEVVQSIDPEFGSSAEFTYTCCNHNPGRNRTRSHAQAARGIRGRCRSCLT